MEIREAIDLLEPEVNKLFDSVITPDPKTPRIVSMIIVLILELKVMYARRKSIKDLVKGIATGTPNKNGTVLEDVGKFLEPIDSWLLEQFAVSYNKVAPVWKDNLLVGAIREEFPEFKGSAELLALIQHVNAK